MRRHWFSLFAIFGSLLAPQLVQAVATNLNLSPPMNRTVELEEGIDPEQWAADNGIDAPVIRQQSDGSTAIDFFVPDSNWDKTKKVLCAVPGVLSCDTNQCRVFLGPQPTPFTGQVANIQGGPVAGAKLMLVPKAPEVSEFVAEEPEPAQRDERQTPGASRCDYNGIDGSVGPIQAQADSDGKFNLTLPGGENFDPGCWELVSADACEVSSQPLPAIMPTFEPGKVLALVRMAQGAGDAQMRGIAEDIAINADLEVLEVTPIESADAALVRFQAQPNFDEETVAMNLRADPRVEESQPDYHYSTLSARNDPFAWMNYGAAQIGVERLPVAADGAGLTIAVIDTGVDAQHPELAAAIDEQIDVTGFGVSPDRHGTAIAGVIAAAPDNEVGAYGVAPGARLQIIKACTPGTRGGLEARCWSSTIAKALDRALKGNAKIINMSLGGPDDPLVRRLIDRAVDDGRLIVAAAGNAGPNAPAPFPASHPNVMAVTAVDASDRLYGRAVQGSFVDVAAPGVDVPVPVPGETYPAQLTGTSMAAAYVSGAAARLLSLGDARTPEAVGDGLESGAVDLGAAARDERFGQGRIDVCTAAELSAESAQNPCN